MNDNQNTTDNYPVAGKTSTGEKVKRVILILVLLILFVGCPLIVLNTAWQGFQGILAPFEQANQTLKTQVAEFLHPTPTIIPDPITIIHEVRSLARLETVRYSVEKVITAEIGQGTFSFLFGDRILFVAHGSVTAGVDLAKLTKDDMKVDNVGALRVHLPDPEIFIVTLDNDKSYVYDRQIGWLTHGEVTLETQARQAAEDAIKQAAVDDGITDLARTNAENYLGRLFTSLGFKGVVFVKSAP